MKRPDRLKQILSQTRSQWERPDKRPAVRSAFEKALQCRTLELGAEVFASEHGERVVYHTCKSRSCSSCGHRATIQWQRERWAALPDVPYKGITFTMPRELWPFFRDNSRLTRALPALAAGIIQAHVIARSGVRVGVVSILHTFNGKLEFNSHVHTMVTAGGLRRSSASWERSLYLQRERLLQSWRRAVIKLLRAALRADQFVSSIPATQIESTLSEQEVRWWSIKVQSFQSKEHFLKYAGRYLRRPPISQRRITEIGDQGVSFWYKDKQLQRKVYIQVALEEFIDRWGQHIHERYQHGVRNFGLFAPRAVGLNFDGIFAVLGQERRPTPKARRWANSIKHDFGFDPLLDSHGQRMKWTRRIAPQPTRK
jgi:hypothetical protein